MTGSLPPIPQAYKRKFVVLINYPTRGLKAVDILEDEFSADTAETIEVNEYDRIEVQERQSKGKGKYGFQVRCVTQRWNVRGGLGRTSVSGICLRMCCVCVCVRVRGGGGNGTSTHVTPN